jgi:hypothetical protein
MYGLCNLEQVISSLSYKGEVSCGVLKQSPLLWYMFIKQFLSLLELILHLPHIPSLSQPTHSMLTNLVRNLVCIDQSDKNWPCQPKSDLLSNQPIDFPFLSADLNLLSHHHGPHAPLFQKAFFEQPMTVTLSIP